MAKRNDTIAPPADAKGLRVEVSTATRDAFRTLAAGHGYSMASLIRLLIEQAVADPKAALKKIPKNSR